MKKKLMTAITSASMLLAFGTALAHPSAASPEQHKASAHQTVPQPEHHRQRPLPKPTTIKKRIARQERDIIAAQRNGSLTPHEAGTLRHNIAKMKTAYLRAKQNDHYFSRKERRHLDNMLEHNRRMLHRVKGNPIRSF